MHSVLAARTDFSLGESILSPEKLVDEAKAVGAKAVAITDTMTVTGMIDFTNRAKKADIKPVIGVRLRFTDDPTWRPVKGEKQKTPSVYFMTAYILSEEGLKAIYRLLTRSYDEDRFYYDNKLAFDDLYGELEKLGPDDLALTTGDTHGLFSHPDHDQIIENIRKANSGIRLYASLVPIDTPYFSRLNELAVQAVRTKGLKPLVVRPAFYGRDEADAHEIMGAVSSNVKVSDAWHRSTYNRDFHVTGVKELVDEVKKAAQRLTQRGCAPAGPLFIEGLNNTADLVEAVKFVWSKADISLPKMADDEFAEVVLLCRQGFKKRFSDQVFGHRPSNKELVEVYKPRLAYELDVLRRLNFAGYFLLVKDVVQYAKSNGILVGPGRGSVGGSLVAYLMGITDCDPIRFGLLFERFINPDRIDLPDIDLDFMSERRHEIIEYLARKYGASRVAGVANYGRLAAASSIRDIGRVLGMSERDTRCSKLAPKAHGANIPLADAAQMVPDIQEFSEKHEAVWNIMLRLEGTMRNYGQHAAGVIVAGCDLVERAVVERRKGAAVLCWDKRIVEDQGLVKMDVLGLNTLDLIKLTLDYIRERHGKRINLIRIPLDDPEVLENFAKGLTTGVFQFESGGMRRLLKELGKDGTITFEDITAATALYRPGPMESGMMDSYYLRKQGLEMVDYDHPLMEPILAPTFGVMVYQEQVMQVARVIAGYSAPDADKLRKIMGKKLPEEMRKERSKFVEGCVKTIGCTEEWAGQLFDKIEGFAGYGFNKSHSVEYSLISWQSMWLKTKYPIEFFAAALSLMDEDKLPAIIRDAERFGIEVVMPDINISTNRFEIVSDTQLVIPFHRIKGISHNTTKAILKAREAGPFKDKQDFLDRVEKRSCNVRHQEALEKVGAFARIEPGQAPAKDPSRVRDQIDLIPGLITDTVPIDRDLDRSKEAKKGIVEVVSDYRAALGPVSEESDGFPVKPFFGKDARFMIITDAPTRQEEESGKMSYGTNLSCVIDAMAVHGLQRADVYWTGLIKRPKSDKQVLPEEIVLYKSYLEREIEILAPPIIVMLGSATVRYFLPDFKGKASDVAGKVVYDKNRDLNLVIGFNPGEIYHDSSKQSAMEDVFHSVMDLLP